MTESEYADHLVDVFLAGKCSVARDAGWEGDSMMGKLIEFQGEIPKSTGNVQSNLSMILAIEKLKPDHALYSDLERVIYGMLGTAGESDKILALLSDRFYRGADRTTGKLYGFKDRLKNIGFAPIESGDKAEDARLWENARKQFRRRVQAARGLLLERMRARTRAA